MKIFDPTIQISLQDKHVNYQEFVFLDIEASALGFGSFPIEVAFATSSGEKAEYLIEPTNKWLNHGAWCKHAELNIHHISKAQLIEQGASVVDVAMALNKALCGRLVFCNDLPYDGAWLASLYETANIGVAFQLTDWRNFLDFCGHSKAAAFELAYQSLTPKSIHRALPDALRFVQAFNQVFLEKGALVHA